MPEYRPEIDGLRAVAVLPVILFHAGFESFSGGYVGVDVFFVISGYLITSIIYGGIRSGSFSLARFYERRARRILPALFLVCVCCIPFSWMWMLPGDFRDFSRSLVAVMVFVSNVLFWQETGYFGAAAELKPLLHTWSLAVEEQFYILFPMSLLLVRKIGKGTTVILIVSCTIASLILAEWASQTHPQANFFLLPTRAWELGIGAVVSVANPGLGRATQMANQIGSISGLGMIVYAVFVFSDSVPFPGFSALLPVLGTALVIVYASPRTFVGRLLAHPTLLRIGLVSYSAYLWHQPLFAFARIRSIGEPPLLIYLFLIAVTFCLAYLSWRFVEQPFRNSANLSRTQIFVSAVVGSVAIASFGVSGQILSGIPNRFPSDVVRLAEGENDKSPLRGRCMSSKDRIVLPENACTFRSGSAKRYAIWGDSHAMKLSESLSALLVADDASLTVFASSSCPPTLGIRFLESGNHCSTYNRKIYDYIIDQANRIDMVFVIARWPIYMEGVRFDNEEGGIETGKHVYALPAEGEPDFLDSSDRVVRIGELYRATIEGLLVANKKAVLVYPVPEVGWHVPRHLAKLLLFEGERPQYFSTSQAVFKERSRNAIHQLEQLEAHRNLIRISPEDVLCSSYVENRCVASIEGEPLYFDDDHLNTRGSELLASAIVEALRTNDWINDESREDDDMVID